MHGDQDYTVQVFCNTDNGINWGNPLQNITGAVGKNQKAGNSKMNVWDVLEEREKLSGEVRFKVVALPGNKGVFSDTGDGQSYKWVKIGTQVWMAENLNYETKSGSWIYENDIKNANAYGRLYDWKTALEVCPEGWNLPTDREWMILEMYLGMSESKARKKGWRGKNEGSKLKEKGTQHWDSPNK